MKKLNTSILPNPYGLNNTGSICYFNSLLQVLASCTSLFDVIFTNKNKVEIVFKKYIDMIKNNNIDSNISSELISALNSKVPYFGNGQESASEAFVLLLESIDNEQLLELFTHRYKCITLCKICDHYSEEKKDHSVIFNLFHLSKLTESTILFQNDELDEYICEKCKSKQTIRKYKLTMAPEILFCSFNIYYTRNDHTFPEFLEFPGKNNIQLRYKLIGQIEHSGSLQGGHYWSRAIRKNNEIYLFNDSSYQSSFFTPTKDTYIIVYHHCD